jgi:hypothetical protein
MRRRVNVILNLLSWIERKIVYINSKSIVNMVLILEVTYPLSITRSDFIYIIRINCEIHSNLIRGSN